MNERLTLSISRSRDPGMVLFFMGAYHAAFSCNVMRAQYDHHVGVLPVFLSTGIVLSVITALRVQQLSSLSLSLVLSLCIFLARSLPSFAIATGHCDTISRAVSGIGPGEAFGLRRRYLSRC